MPTDGPCAAFDTSNNGSRTQTASSKNTSTGSDSAKADMEHIYNQLDPRAYFSELRKLDYRIPAAAKPIFNDLIAILAERHGERVRALDLGCSYGVNGALLKFDLDLAGLYDRWDCADADEASNAQTIAKDRAFFGAMDQRGDLEVVGLDPAMEAVTFAREAGLIDTGIIANLEEEELTADAAATLEPVGLVLSTGCVGYVTRTSFEKMLPALTRGNPPWIANFVLRMFPFDPIAEALDDWGYVTHKLEGRTFPQRRFASQAEREQVLDALESLGIDPNGREAEGELHAEFYLSRPRADADQPLAELIGSPA